MHRALSSRWLRSALGTGDRAALVELPSYLCPALSGTSFRVSSSNSNATTLLTKRTHPAAQQHRRLHTISATEDPQTSEALQNVDAPKKKTLPMQCHGCGGFAQSTDPDQAGYYDLDRRAVRRYLGLEGEDGKPLRDRTHEDMVVEQALGSVDAARLAELGIDASAFKHGDELDPHGTCMSSNYLPPFEEQVFSDVKPPSPSSAYNADAAL